MNYLLYTGKKHKIMKRIIIIAVALLTMHACWIEPEPEDPTIEFYIKNISSQNVEITIFNAGIPNQSSKDITFPLASNSGISYFYGCSSNEYPLVDAADSAFIIFNNERQIIYRKNDGRLRNMLDINIWDRESNAVIDYIYIYTINNEDYENAVNIK